MACLVLKLGDKERRIAPDPDGQFRYRLQPGEVFDGSIDPDCGGQIALQPGDDSARLIAELDEELGKKGMGDWFKRLAGPVAKAIGKADCMSCEVRRVIANAYARLKAKRGKLKAIAAIIGLVALSFVRSEEAVAKKLKEYLRA